MAREDLKLLLDAYDAQLRAHVHDRVPDSIRIERDGPLVRTYRALVACRAKLAAERGRRYIEVDASDDSRPILERLGSWR